METKKIKERTVWRVSSGNRSRYFAGEIGARDYASDRYDKDLDGVPFVSELTLTEVLNRLNELESVYD